MKNPISFQRFLINYLLPSSRKASQGFSGHIRNRKFHQISEESGQIVLMVLLTMVIGLTIALGIFADSLTDTALTISQENSEKAFNMAEAGIENLLAGKGGGSGQEDVGNLKFDIATAIVPETNLEVYVNKNETVEFKLKEDAKQVNKVTINWTNKNDQEQYDKNTPPCSFLPAGLILTLISDNGDKIEYLAYKPKECIIPSEYVGFISSSAGSTIEGIEFLSKIVNLDVKDYSLLRVRPIFNDASIRVEVGDGIGIGSTDIIQQETFTSNASVVGSMESRKIEVVRPLPSLPEVFDYTLFSAGTIN